MEYSQDQEITFIGQSAARSALQVGRKLSTHYKFECHDKDGNLKWVDEFDNLVVTAGLNDSLTQHFKGSGYTAAWFVGITGASPTFAAGDTMASHGGWTEVTAVSNSARPTLTLGSVSAGSVDNSASKAVFTVNVNGTAIGGAFVVTNSTLGGTTGTLYGGGALTEGNRTLASSDTISVTVTLTASAS